MEAKTTVKKCYNQVSCLLSVLIIVFVIGAVVYDMVVSKPQIRQSIEEIKIEVEQINQKIDARQTVYMPTEQDILVSEVIK